MMMTELKCRLLPCQLRFSQTILFILFLLIGFSAPAQADEFPHFLRRGTNPFSYSFGIGPAVAAINSFTQFDLSQNFGYHFWGDSEGPALGAFVDMSAGGGFLLQIGPRFSWDIQPIHRLGFYIEPYVQLGYAVASRFNFVSHFVNLQVGMRAKLLFMDRLFAFFQPFALDFFFGDHFEMRSNLLFGGGVTF